MLKDPKVEIVSDTNDPISYLIQERDGSNNPTVSYTRGTDLSGSLEGAGGIGGLLARSSGYSGGNWSTHNDYHADGNGNITYLVNSSQGLAASYKYDAFGNTLSSSGTLASANVYRFSSKEIHVNSGMNYFGYRWYDPSVQRWLNRDPIGEVGFELRRFRAPAVGYSLCNPAELSQGPKQYDFVDNTPERFFDSYGLESDFCKTLGSLMNKLGRKATAEYLNGNMESWQSLKAQIANLGKVYKKLCTDPPDEPPSTVPVICPVQSRRVPPISYPPTNVGIVPGELDLAGLLEALEEAWPVVFAF